MYTYTAIHDYTYIIVVITLLVMYECMSGHLYHTNGVCILIKTISKRVRDQM